MYQWSKPCPGRDAIREGKTEYEGQPCPACGSNRRYAAGGACVLCSRALSKSRNAPLPLDAKQLDDDAARMAEGEGDEMRQAIKFLLASLSQGPSALRISRAAGIPRGTAYKYATICRDAGLWGWDGSLYYEWATDEGDPDRWFAIYLDAMVLMGILYRADGEDSA